MTITEGNFFKDVIDTTIIYRKLQNIALRLYYGREPNLAREPFSVGPWHILLNI